MQHDELIHYEIIIIIQLVITSLTSNSHDFFFEVHLRSSLSNFQVHSIINYSRHALHGLPRWHSDKRSHLPMQYNWFPRICLQMLYNWFPRIIYLIIESLYTLTNISPFPAPLIPGNHLLLCFYRQTILDSMYKWDRALCVSLCVIYFP